MRLEIGIDANDVERLATFWQSALGYDRGSGDGQPYLNLTPRDGRGPIVFLQHVPEAKTVKDRLHLDLYVEDPQRLVARLVEAGATELRDSGFEGESWWQVMADPEGNEFCVCKETR